MPKKYAIVVDDKTKACNVGVGEDIEFYKSLGMTLQDVEQAANGGWYLKGYCPAPVPKVYRYDRYKLMNALFEQKITIEGKETNLWNILKNFLMTEKEGFYKDCWDSCISLLSNDPNFIEPLAALKSQYPNVDVDSILKDCIV